MAKATILMMLLPGQTSASTKDLDRKQVLDITVFSIDHF